MADNKISIIVVTYNQEKTIGRTLDSILMQRCHIPFEIVVGEDCSTDGTRDICESYAQRYPHIVHMMPKAPNKGVIDNYFDCLLACDGKYIADCAGDDFWTDPEKLEKEVCILEQYPSVTLVHTNWRFYNENDHSARENTFVPFPDKITSGKTMLEAIITPIAAPAVHTCTSMYRAETIKKCYFADTELFRNKEYGCEDMQLVFMLALNGDVAFLPDYTLNYSVGHISITTQPDEKKQFRFVRRTTSLSFLLARRYGIDTPCTRKYFADKVYALLMHAFRSHSKKLRDEATCMQKEWLVSDTRKIKFIKSVMSHNISWRMMLVARALFVCAKALAGRLKQRV